MPPARRAVVPVERAAGTDAYGNRALDYFAETVEIAEQDARAAGAIGFTARLFAQLALPYRDPGDIREWRRENGSLTLIVHPGLGRDRDGKLISAYPYGVMPRLLTTWMATEAVRTQERELRIAASLRRFLAELGMAYGGGPRGAATRLRDQMTRTLMATLILDDAREANLDKAAKFDLADHYQLWWSRTDDPATEPLWASSIVLSERFFQSVISAPVPVDMRAIKALRGSPLRLDIYTWLTHRMSYLRRPTTVPWEALAVQFGGDYAQLRQFKAAFLKQLDKVRAVYPFADVHQAEHGLLLMPSRPHVAPLPSRPGTA